ncbi:hypothetical protein ACKKBG_A25540 [Auxenochlorella protothecoides x Auxenochlorella symbiontica]
MPDNSVIMAQTKRGCRPTQGRLVKQRYARKMRVDSPQETSEEEDGEDEPISSSETEQEKSAPPARLIPGRPGASQRKGITQAAPLHPARSTSLPSSSARAACGADPGCATGQVHSAGLEPGGTLLEPTRMSGPLEGGCRTAFSPAVGLAQAQPEAACPTPLAIQLGCSPAFPLPLLGLLSPDPPFPPLESPTPLFRASPIPGGTARPATAPGEAKPGPAAEPCAEPETQAASHVLVDASLFATCTGQDARGAAVTLAHYFTDARFLDSCQSGLLRHLVVLEEKVDSVAARCAGDPLRNAKANALLHHAYSWLKTSYYFQDRAAVASLRWPAGLGDDRSRQPK